MVIRQAIVAAVTLLAIGLSAVSEGRADQPYSDLRDRQIKALSEAEIADLNEGNGMGLALAAELNGYPGPRHVIDLASALSLTLEQKDAISRLVGSMRDQAVAIGRELVAEEAELERLFQLRTIDEASLRVATQRIAALRGQLRFVHLRYHLETEALLSEGQRLAYNRLRGYEGNGNPPAHGTGGGHRRH